MKKTLVSALVSSALLIPAIAGAATIEVTPSNMQGWGFLQETPTGSGSIVAGPAGGLGDGSANLIVDGTGGVIVAKAHVGTELSDITNLEYRTYRDTGGAALAIALQFNFDSDVTDGNNAFQGRLVYEPYYTHTVLDDTWQTWDPMDNSTNGSGDGNWWFSNGTHATNSGCSIATPCTWAEILAAFPNGGIHNTLGAVVLKAGGGWAGGFNGNVDALTIGISNVDSTFDFEENDTAAPVVSAVVVSPIPAIAGQPTTLTANVNDTTTGNSNITSAEYRITGGGWSGMSASDGAFDEPNENATTTFVFATPGIKEVCVRGTDAAGNTSSPIGDDCVIVEVIDPQVGHVSGGGSTKVTKGKPNWTFGGNAGYVPGVGLVGQLQVVDHVTKTTCHYNTITSLTVVGNTATVVASGKNCGPTTLVYVDNGEPGKNDKFQNVVLAGGNIKVAGTAAPSVTKFSASDSAYYNGMNVSDGLYGTGPITFTWDGAGNVTGGLWEEIVPAGSGTHYFNIVTGGTVVGGAVNLNLLRTNPGAYGPFTIVGTLTGSTLTGTAAGPYLFTATGTITP